MFTGNKETDKIVLSQLDDYDLSSACTTNKHLNEICKDETFWRNRTLARFGPYLGNAEQIKEYMKNYDFETWKKYYISLIDFLEKVYDGTISVKPQRKKIGSRKPGAVPIKDNSREDLEILKGIIDRNNQELDEIVTGYVGENFAKEKNMKNFYSVLDKELNRDMINPNILFVPNDLVDERLGPQIMYLLNSKDKRIRPNYDDFQVIREFANNHDYRADNANDVFTRLVNDDRINPNVLFANNYDSQYIVPEYLYILAKSDRILGQNYPKLMSLILNAEERNDIEEEEEEDLPPTFRDYAKQKLTSVLAKLE